MVHTQRKSEIGESDLLITKSEFRNLFDYDITNLICKFDVKPVKTIGKLNYYNKCELILIRDKHIKDYIDKLKESGFTGTAYRYTELKLVQKNPSLSYKKLFSRNKAEKEGISVQTTLYRLNEGLKMLGIQPKGFTYNGKLIYSLSDFEKAYKFFVKNKLNK
jgi:Fe2+ or Zn2+ uptake regulation protein